MSKKLIVSVEEKKYKDEPRVQALGKNVFQINPGEFVCILGPSGCGKSTLLRVISGIDMEFQGNVVLGKRIVKNPEKECGIVFQEPRLMPWYSVGENITFGMDTKAESKEKISELLKLVGLEGFSNAYPHQLSGGMAQRVALARALVNIPDLLLLDEPFASLDSLTRIKLQEELAQILKKEKTTVLMVTHDIEEAIYLSDRILIMSNRPGKIVKEYKVDIPKPRKRTGSAFVSVKAEIMKDMEY